MGWTDEHEQVLRDLYALGHSYSKIAEALNRQFRDAGYTRNAICGKADRLNLVGREKPAAPRAVRAPAVEGDRRQFNRVSAPHRRPKALPVARATPIYSGDPATSPAQKKLDAIRANLACEPLPEAKGQLSPTCDLLGLGGCMCKWPIGDPQHAGFGFCGRRADDGPYCPSHAKRAYASHAAREWVDKRLAMPTRAQRAA